MFAQRLSAAFDLTNRRLVYPLLFFFLGLPAVGLMLSAGELQEPASAANLGLALKFFGFILLYALLALFVWPFAYGGVIGELAASSGGAVNWGLFKTAAVKNYGRLLLFNLLLFVLAAVFLFVFVLIAVFGLLASSLGSGDLSALEEQLSQPQPSSGIGAFAGQFASTLFAEAALLVWIAAMITLVLSERGLWRSLGAGFKTFFTRPVFKLYLLAFLAFLFLNLLGVLIFNRPGVPRLFSGVYFVIVVLLQAYFTAFAIAFLLPAFKPKEEAEASYAPTG